MIDCTMKLQYKDHTKDQQNLGLYTGSLNLQVLQYGKYTDGGLLKIFFTRR